MQHFRSLFAARARLHRSMPSHCSRGLLRRPARVYTPLAARPFPKAQPILSSTLRQKRVRLIVLP